MVRVALESGDQDKVTMWKGRVFEEDTGGCMLCQMEMQCKLVSFVFGCSRCIQVANALSMVDENVQIWFNNIQGMVGVEV